MTAIATVRSEPWYLRPTFFRIAGAILAIILAVEAYSAIVRKDNDFLWHRIHGQDFISGEPYIQAGYWYPLGRKMMNAGLALIPYRVSRALVFTLAVAGLVACYFIWSKLADRRVPIDPKLSLSAGLLTAILFLPYVLRDLDECGLQLLLLFFMSAAAWALAHDRAVRAGLWLATAATYKLTPVIALGMLLWKRKWTAAASMAVFAVLWGLAPALYLGWNKTVDSQKEFFAFTRRAAADRQAYPGVLEYEAPKQQNQSLSAMLGRYAQTFPPDHPLYLNHPAYVQFGNLEPETAYRFVKVVTLMLAAGLAWHFRRRWGNAPGEADLATEWSIVCLLCALVAPICWKHHLVLALPPLFLAIRAEASRGFPRTWRLVALLTMAGLMVLTRHNIIGRELSVVVSSYKIDTMMMLVVGYLALSAQPQATAAAAANGLSSRVTATPQLRSAA